MLTTGMDIFIQSAMRCVKHPLFNYSQCLFQYIQGKIGFPSRKIQRRHERAVDPKGWTT